MAKHQSAIKLLFLFLVLCSCSEKRHYWIYFNSTTSSLQKKGSEDTVINSSLKRFAESLKYQTRLGEHSVQMKYYSEWLNAGVVVISENQRHMLLRQEYIKEISPVRSMKFSREDLAGEVGRMSFALDQIEGKYFIEKGLTGKGVKIGIIDGGFLNADKKNSLSHVFERNNVKEYRDFLTPNLHRYGGSKAADDGHGTDVWEQISGVNTDRKVQFGLATESEFILARTDDGRKEYRQEEIFFVQALEWMEKQGVKLVNISLGFSTGYDNLSDNYLPTQINGNFSAATRAANIASEEKGMLLVVSVGNDGGNDFKVLSAPADSKGAISVGATSFKNWSKASFSSIGSNSLKYLKPNVSCFSYEGTSFSAPVITGMAACLMQYDSSFQNSEIKSIIERSSSLYPFGNNYIGYGVPSCKKAIQILNSRGELAEFISEDEKFMVSDKRILKIRMHRKEGALVLFHKSDSVNVLAQVKDSFEDFEYRISRPKNVHYTTVAANDFVVEVRWK